MTGRLPTFALIAAAAVVVCAEPQTPQRPTFRSGATLVPVDVRVIDARGNPVTNLTKADFSIREDGVAQDISQFVQHTLSATAGPAALPAARRQDPEALLAPQNQRIFLILLGRGHLQAPSNGIDGALAFVRERLLPQDAVAVMAWNRATSFTVNRAEIIGVLERFKARHDRIETRLAHWFSGLQAMYGSLDIPAAFQRDIDAVFAADSGPQPKTVPAAAITGEAQIAEEQRRRANALLEGSSGLRSADPIASSINMSFDEYVASNKQTIQDVANIYTGIEYLRYIDGEKHLLFITEAGFLLPSSDDDEGLAAMANDARVAIDTIHTGGLRGNPFVTDFTPAFQAESLRDISRLTGGTASAYRYASDAVDRIDRATRASYLLGYYPQSATLDGRYRKVAVTVHRPGLTLEYRHGYYARESLAPLDRPQAVSYARISAAGMAPVTIRDLGVGVKAHNYFEPGSKNVVVAGHITVSPDRVQFNDVDGQHVASLHVAVFCGGPRQRMVGQRWREVQLSFSDEAYQAFLKDGLGIDINIPVTAAASFVKAIVYDQKADLVGTAMVRIR